MAQALGTHTTWSFDMYFIFCAYLLRLNIHILALLCPLHPVTPNIPSFQSFYCLPPFPSWSLFWSNPLKPFLVSRTLCLLSLDTKVEQLAQPTMGGAIPEQVCLCVRKLE